MYYSQNAVFSNACYNLYGPFTNDKGEEQYMGRSMSWSLIKFEQIAHFGLHTNVELLLYQYNSIQQGGPLYFSF